MGVRDGAGVERVQDQNDEEEDADQGGGDEQLRTPAPAVGVQGAEDGAEEGEQRLGALLCLWSQPYAAHFYGSPDEDVGKRESDRERKGTHQE